jgi:hypothetical protein
VVSADTPVSFTNKPDCHDITEILLKVALNNPTPGDRYIESLISTDDIKQKY